jgi:3-keto-disaccharide hydrolase
MTMISRRQLVMGLSGMGACMAVASRMPLAAQADDPFDFRKPLDGWETVSGDWAIQEVPGASQDGRALVQRAIDNEFNVIVAPGGPYSNLLVTARFKPLAGREDASGGIVFRFSEGRYYLARANALEDNFRFYYHDRSRHMISSTTTKAPSIGQWHKLQVSAKADRIQAWLNDRLLIDQRDSRFAAGHIGFWTKTDSITAFDSITVLSMDG